MSTEAKHHTPWYLWPFVAIWKLLATIVEMTGRLLAMILGRPSRRKPTGVARAEKTEPGTVFPLPAVAPEADGRRPRGPPDRHIDRQSAA